MFQKVLSQPTRVRDSFQVDEVSSYVEESHVVASKTGQGTTADGLLKACPSIIRQQGDRFCQQTE